MARTSKICLRDSRVQGNRGALRGRTAGSSTELLAGGRKPGCWHCPRAAPEEKGIYRSKRRTSGSTQEQELSKQKLFLHPRSFRT